MNHCIDGRRGRVEAWLRHGVRLLALAGGVLLAAGPARAALSIDDNAKAGARMSGYEVPKSTSGITYLGGDSFYVVADDGNDTTYELGLHTFTFKFRDDDGTYTMFHRKPSTASEVRAGHVTLEKTFDLEACAYDPGSGNVWAANEAGSGSAAANTIREYNPKTGKIVSELTVPNVIRQNARGNFGLEALTISGDGLTLWTCNEEALTCDGNRSSASESTTVRLVKFTRATTSDAFQLAAMYGYTVPKWEHGSGGMAASSQRNGVSGLCALPDGTLLVLERELSNDYFVNRICVADVRSATDVKGFSALKGTTWTGAARTVLKRFWSGGGDVNLLSRNAYNYEGICLGPREPNGNHLLMLIADAGDGHTSPYVRAEHLHGLDSRTLAFGRPPVGTATCVGQNFRLDATRPFTMTVTGLGSAKLRWRLPNHTPSTGIVTAASPSFSFTPSADDTLTWEVAGEEEEEPEAHEHAWGAGSVTTQPTCGATGVRTYTCSCGETKTETIPATGDHTYADGVCATCGGDDPNYVPPSTATTYYLVGSDGQNLSSFTKSSSTTAGWAAREGGSVVASHTVSADYDYVIPDGSVMRLPATTGALTFAGKSLTIVQNGGILLKGTHVPIKFAQLVCNGGAITAGDAGKIVRFSGPMTILGGTTLGFTILRPDSTSDTTVTFDELRGTGTLRLKASEDTAASKTQTLVISEAGDFQGVINAVSYASDKKFILKVTGGFGGTVASLPKGTSKVVFNYSRLDPAFGVRVAALDAGDVAVTAPPEGFVSGLVLTCVADTSAADLPLVTFPATVTVDPTAFTVRYAASAEAAATAFANLAAIRNGDGTTTLVANHAATPVQPTDAKGFARAKAENRPVRVLVIGNSFTQGISRAPRLDGTKLVETRTHFPTAVRAMGEQIDYCALYRGGSTIQQHYENRATKGFFAEINWSFDSAAPSWANGAKDGQFVCDEDSTTCDNSESLTPRDATPPLTTPFHISLDDLLAAVDWDVIVIQESSSVAQFPAGTPESLWTGVNAANEARRDYGRGTPRYAFGNLYEYVAYLKGARPGAELWIHQTWAHEKDSRQVELGTMAKCDEMYNAINASVASVAASYGLKVIPTGYAVQRYRHELPVSEKTQDPCSFDSRHINGGDYLYGESRIPADQLYRTYLQIMTWCQRFYGKMPPAGFAGVANTVAKTDPQRSNAGYVELNGAPWFEPSNAAEKTVMRACAAAAGALETYPDMEIAEEPDPSVQATYYFVGGDAAGKSSFAGSTAGAASGWATSVGGPVITHTVAAGNAYVVPNTLGLRAAESPQNQTFKGSRLVLRTGSLYSKKSVDLTIPELAVENAGTIYFGAGNLTIKILGGDIKVPEDATLHLKMLFDTTTSASALELRSRLVGAGLIRICDATNDKAPTGTQTLLIAEADEYTGSIYAKDEPYAQRFVLKVTGGFGGTIESLPNGTEKVVFNLAGLDPSVGVRVSDDAAAVPAGFASGLVFFGVTNPSAADLPLVTFPAGMAVDPTAFTVGHATGADAAATPFAALGAVANADGTTTLVANPTATPVDPPDDPPVGPTVTDPTWRTSAFDAAHTIVCYGDSLTYGRNAGTTTVGSRGNFFDGRLYGQTVQESYPYYLSARVPATVNVIAQARSGMYADMILAWQGGRTIKTAAAFTLPKSGSVTLANQLLFDGTGYGDLVAATPSLQSQYGGLVAPYYALYENAGEGGVKKTIVGRLGSAYVRLTGDDASQLTVTALSSLSGDLTVPAGTTFQPISSLRAPYADAIQVIFAGTNDGAANAADVIAQIQAAVARIPSGRYVVISSHANVFTGSETVGQATPTAIEQAYAAAFGEHHLNLRLALAAKDANWRTDGKLDTSDNLHFKSAGYDLVSEIVHEKLIRLGYVEGTLPDDPPVTEYVRTVSANTTEQNLVFEGTDGRLVLDNATLTVSGTVAQYVAYRFGENATGALTLDVSGANAGLAHSTAISSGFIGSTTAASDMLVKFTVPAAPWTVAPIRATAGDSKVRFQRNVSFAVDATAVANPGAGQTVKVPLASATDGVRFDGVEFATVKQRSAVACADGVTGELGLEDNLLYLLLAGSGGEGPQTKPVYYLVGEDKSDNGLQFTKSTADASTGWAESKGGAVITHTVAAGNDYVVDGETMRTPTSVSTVSFAGDTLKLTNNGTILVKGTHASITIPSLVIEGSGGVTSGDAGKNYAFGGTVTVGEGATFGLTILRPDAIVDSSVTFAEIVGAGTLRLKATEDKTASTKTLTLALGETKDFTGTINAVGYTCAKRFILKVTGGFGGTIASLPCGTEKAVFNYGGLDAAKGVVVAATDATGGAVTAVPDGLTTGLVLFNVADVTAAGLPLVTFPATVAVDPTAFTVGYAASADGAVTAFANLGVVENGDGTKTLVANCAQAMTVTAADYNAPYDRAEHTITLTVSSPSDATIQYRTSESDPWSTTKPTRKDAGTTTVYYQITKPGWTTVTGSKQIIVTQAANSLTVTMADWTYGQAAKEPVLTVDFGSTIVSYEYYQGTTKLAGKPTNAGTYKVKATVPEAANFAGASGEATFTILRSPTAVEPTKANRTYSGAAQNGYSAAGTHVTLAGTTSATAAGSSYSFTATPEPNYAWSDGTFAAKTYNWSIGKKALTATASSHTVAYGAAVPSYSVSYSGWASTGAETPTTAPVLQCGYTTSSTVAGSPYAVTFKTAPVFANYSVTTVNGSVTVTRAKTAVEPTVNTGLVYTGASQSGVKTSGTYVTLGGTQSATKADSYTFTATPDANHAWSDGGTGAKTYNWSIGKKALTATASSHTVAYGAAVPSYSVSYSGWASAGAETPTTAAALTSTYTVTSPVGTYPVTFKTAPVFANYAVTTVEGAVTVERAKTAVAPTKQDRTYTGAAQNGYSDAGAHVTLAGTMSATAAGSSYSFTATPEPNYAWSDGTFAAKSYTWTMSPASVTVPTAVTGLTYDRTEKTGVSNIPSTTYATASGTAKATNADSYSVTYTLTSTTNYKWSDNTTAAKTVNWSIARKTLTVTGLAATSRAYNGSKNVTLSGGTLSGVVSGDDVSATMPTSGTVADANVGTGKAVTFTTITLSGTKKDNYSLTQPTVTVNITQASVTVPTAVTGLTYNGSEQTGVKNIPGTTYATLTSGAAKGTAASSYSATYTLTSTTNCKWSDNTTAAKTVSWSIAAKSITPTVSLSKTSATYGDSGWSTLPTVTVTGDSKTLASGTDYTASWSPSSVTGQGTYTVTVTLKGNYSGSKTATYTVNKRTITINWANTSLTYTGSAQKPTATAGNLKSGDTVELTVSGEQTNVGSGYTATAAFSATQANYALPSPATTTFSIAKAGLTATASSHTVAYGDAAPEYTVSYTGWKKGAETPTTAAALTSTYAQGSASGGDYPVTFATAPVFANYSVTTVNGKVTVNKKAVTVTPKASQSKTYGDSDPTLTYDYTPTLVGSDKFTGALARASGETVGTYAISQGTLALGGNYTLAFTTGKTFEIKKRTITINWANTSLTYTGSAQKPTATAGNLKSGDTVELTVSGEQTNVGSGYTATAAFSATQANYALPSPATTTFSIAKAGLTATASSHTVAYGAEAPAYAVSYTGWKKGEETPTTAAALTSTYTATSPVGTYPVTFKTAPVFANYAVTTVEGVVTVERAKTAVEPTAANRTYTGAAQNGYSAAGIHVTLGGTTSATAAGDGYSFTATPEPNYAWSDGTTGEKTYTWKIAPAALTIALTATSRAYDGTDVVALTAGELAGVKGNDQVAVANLPTAGTIADANVGTAKPVSFDALTLTGAAAVNYTLVQPTVTVDITLAAAKVAADAASKTCGEGDPELTATVTGTIGDDKLTYTVTRIEGEDVGTYAITVTGAATQGNYAVTYEGATFTIEPAPQTGAAEIGGTSYATVAEACAKAEPGETVKLVRAPTTEDQVAFKPGVTVDLNGQVLADGAYTTPGEWFDVRKADGKATIELNAKARPTIEGQAGESEAAFKVEPDKVTVAVGNVNPNLYYGLAAATTLEGLATARPTTWMPADGEGKLEPLTVDKTAGAKAEFYRVVVRDLPEP